MESARLPGKWTHLVERIETRPIGFLPYVASLAAIILTRNLLEAYSSTGFIEQAGSYLLHYPLAYIAPLLALSSALSLLSKVPVIRVTRLMLYLWLLTLLPPLLDMLIASGGARDAEQIGYLAVAPGEYWNTFVDFFNPRASLKGTTAGIRIEALLACLLSAVYVGAKSRSVMRALVTPFVIFALSFFFFTFPHVYLAVVRAFHPEIPDFTGLFLTKGLLARTDSARLSLLMAQVDLILTATVLLVWLGLYAGRRALRRVLSPVFSWSSLFAVAMTAAGFYLGWRIILPHEALATVLSHHSDFLSLLSLLLAATGAAAGLLVIARPQEPNSDGATRGQIAAVLLVFAAANALVTGFAPFCFLLVYIAMGIVRDLPPFALRTYALLSSLTQALGGVALVSMSYCLFASSRTPSYLPREVLPLLFAGLLAGSLILRIFRGRPRMAPALRLAGALVLVLVPALFHDDLPRTRDPRWGTPEETRHAELGSMFASQGRRDLARVEYEEAARLGSPDPWVYQELGLEHAREGNALLAIDMFRKATERDPSFGEAHYNLAMACAQEGMDEEAVKSFTRALELLPDREEVRLGTLAFLTERGRFAEALTLLLSGTMTTTQEQLAAFEIMNRISESAEEIRADTSSAGGRFLAKFLEPVRKSRQGRWEAAIGDLVALRNEYPHVLPILYFEAWALQRKGSTDEARAAYELFLTRVPGVYDARINLGAAYVNLGKLSEAREIFEEILAERPGDTMALVNLANAYTKEGKLEESLVLLQQALAHDPESYIAGVNLGIVLEGLSRTDEAIARYESLLISRRETPELYVRLAGCYMRKGDLVRTRENLGRALALDPSYAPARNALASLDERGGASGQTQDSQGGNR